jgi:heme/copper-type cytochrome/quinol oxidase subunit 3
LGKSRIETRLLHINRILWAFDWQPIRYTSCFVEARYLRIAYAIQFAVTLIAAFEVWVQVGGQGHLDLMPWYSKLLLPAALSLATVKATAAAVHRDRIRNARTSWWLAAALALIATMGILTYYEHLHEEVEEETPAQVDLS